MKPKTALVTGAYGFIGRHLSRRLAALGWTVVGLGHGGWSREEWRRWGLADWHMVSVTPEALLTYGGEPEVIWHCAGSGAVGFSMAHPYQDFQRTVATTSAVLEFTRSYAPEARVIFLSSAGVYGQAEQLPITEAAPLNPVSLYGVHKKMGEDLCRSYGRHFGTASAVVRFFSIYGPGLRKQLLWDACGKISHNDVTFAGSGLETRDFLHIDDAVELLVRAAEQASPDCPVVNGGSGTGVTVRELLEEIFSLFKCHELPIFTGKTRPGDPLHYEADISRARAWGWQPKIHWRQGVRQYCAWFQKETQ